MHLHVSAVLLASCFVAATSGRTLLFTHVLWRHGDRSPVVVYKTDPNTPASWVQGLGQLTAEGMREELKLGQLLKSMYVGPGKLLSSDYSQFQVRVRSTDVNRTLQSAYGVMAGMWSGKAGVTVPSEAGWPQPWLPIPVHTIPHELDHLLDPLTKCTAYSNYRNNVVHKSDAYMKFVTPNQPFFNWLSTKAGYKVSFDSVWIIEDDMFIELSNNRTEPAWMNATVQKRIHTLTDANNNFMFAGLPLARLSGGPLLAEIVNRMHAFIACIGSSDSRHCKWLQRLRIYAYSAHDITVLALLATLQRQDAVSGGGLPSYAAAIAIELWQENDGSYSVQVKYKDGYKRPAFVNIAAKGCPTGTPCPLGTFTKRSQPYMPADIVAECNVQTLPTQAPSIVTPVCDVALAGALNTAMIVLAILVSVLGLGVLFVGYKLYSANKEPKSDSDTTDIQMEEKMSTRRSSKQSEISIQRSSAQSEKSSRRSSQH